MNREIYVLVTVMYCLFYLESNDATYLLHKSYYVIKFANLICYDMLINLIGVRYRYRVGFAHSACRCKFVFHC